MIEEMKEGEGCGEPYAQVWIVCILSTTLSTSLATEKEKYKIKQLEQKQPLPIHRDSSSFEI